METLYLQEYVQVANLGSFTAAAVELHLTQSTLSKHIAALEREYGVELFTRNRRGVRLTEAGRVLYLQAVKLDRLLGQTERLLGALPLGTAASDMSVLMADPSRNPALRCKCRACALKFQLDERETGALVLYLEEFSLESMRKELGVSRDEAAELLGSAYRKLGVSDKQQALDLIHSFSE